MVMKTATAAAGATTSFLVFAAGSSDVSAFVHGLAGQHLAAAPAVAGASKAQDWSIVSRPVNVRPAFAPRALGTRRQRAGADQVRSISHGLCC